MAGMKIGRAEARVQAALRYEAEGLIQRAEREYRAALELAPRHPVALTNLGTIYASRGRFADAAPLFRRAMLANAADPIPQINLAGVLRELGDEAGAIDTFSRIIEADPGSRPARLNLANLLRSQGRLDEARPHYQALLTQDPCDGSARWNLAALEGLAGDFDAAFAGFAAHHALEPAMRPSSLPRWMGEPLAGRRILLEHYQGLGDALMFSRFARGVRGLGGRVILRAQPELEPLLKGVEGVEAYARSDRPAPPADLWFPLVDLPALGVGSRGEFWSAPYICAPAERVAAWSARLRGGRPFRVGLVWAGNPTHPDDRNRSAPLQSLLGPVSAIDGIQLISLQKGVRAAEADGTPLVRADLEIVDFEDTAALLTQLDLLITVDTSVLHLAGAMGCRTWALLPFAPDWRWMLRRSDTPWYPGVTLFRQTSPRDWAGVMDRVGAALRTLSLSADRKRGAQG